MHSSKRFYLRDAGRALVLGTFALCWTAFGFNDQRTEFWKSLIAGESQDFVLYGTSVSHEDNVKWPQTLNAQLDEQFHSGLASRTNLSSKGSYSSWGADNINDVVSRQPDLVILEFATNDAVGRFNCDVACATANWEVMITTIQQDLPDCEIVLFATHRAWDYNSGCGGSDKNDCMGIEGRCKWNWSKRNCPTPMADYMQMVRDLADQYNTFLVDIWDESVELYEQLGDDGYKDYVYDGHHTTQKMADEIIVPAILKTLQGSGPAPALTMTGPKRNSAFNVGDQVEITWTHNPDSIQAMCYLDFSVDAGRTYRPLNNEMFDPNRETFGSFLWTIPPEISGVSMLSDEVYLKVYEYDSPRMSIIGPIIIRPEGFVEVFDTLDNTDPRVTTVGGWVASSYGSPYGGNYVHDENSGQGAKNASYSPGLPSAGLYKILVYYVSADNRATNAPIDIYTAAGVQTVTINQQENGGQWNEIGTFNLGTDGKVVIKNDGANGYVVADGVAFELVSGSTGVERSITNARASAPAIRNALRITVGPNRSLTLPDYADAATLYSVSGQALAVITRNAFAHQRSVTLPASIAANSVVLIKYTSRID